MSRAESTLVALYADGRKSGNCGSESRPFLCSERTEAVSVRRFREPRQPLSATGGNGPGMERIAGRLRGQADFLAECHASGSGVGRKSETTEATDRDSRMVADVARSKRRCD